MKSMLMVAAVLASVAALPAQADTVTPFGTATGSGPWTIDSTSATFGGITVVPSASLTFSQLLTLSASYTDLLGGAGGGSPRISVGLQNGISEDYVHILLGTSPNFNDSVATLNAGSGMNLIGNNDAGRYDVSQFGGSPFTDYNTALALVGGLHLDDISFVMDGGWSASGEQLLTLNSLTINDTVITGVSPTPVPEPKYLFPSALALLIGVMAYRKKKQGLPLFSSAA